MWLAIETRDFAYMVSECSIGSKRKWAWIAGCKWLISLKKLLLIYFYKRCIYGPVSNLSNVSMYKKSAEDRRKYDCICVYMY